MMRGPALLFCPADRPDRFTKATAAADSVILDLEDAVLPDAKAAAREALVASRLDPAATIVRVNPVGSPDHALDLAALAATEYRTIMLAKAEAPPAYAGLAGFDIIALIETALGVVRAADIAAAPNVVALMWGPEDLVASTGGRSARYDDGRFRDFARHARSVVLLAASAHGKDAIDTVHIDIADAEGLRAEVADAAASGFAATACIHPSQAEIVRRGYAPSEAERAWAREVLAAAEAERGVFRFAGRMIDEPVLRQARRMLGADG
jgi:citrate lyase subunit beta/citryl-CoA lyase